jgi:hypothetical protein
VAGQIPIGIGCAPAFLVCTVYIARHFPPARYTMVFQHHPGGGRRACWPPARRWHG